MHVPLTDQVRDFLATGTRTGKVAWVATDGRALIAPIWFVVDGDEIVFNTGSTTAKAKALSRDARLTMVVDLEEPPYAFVQVQGDVTIDEAPDELLRTATAIGARYMGAARAEEFGRRNGVPGEWIVRLRPTRVTTNLAVSD